MAPAFSKEAILTGDVDHFCLVCENYMRTDDEVSAHITESGHRKKFEDTDYVEKYKGDCIRKIKKWYFCEFCNILLSTLTKVGLHVKEVKHNENKTTKRIERRGDYVILLGNVAVHEEAWHGLIDDTCIICNIEFDDIVIHKKEATHIINLIKSTVSYVDNNVYRESIDDTFHCLTCNAVVADIFEHLRDEKHDKFLEDCKQVLLKIELPRNEIAFTNNVTEEDSTVEEKKGANLKKGVNQSKDGNGKTDGKVKKGVDGSKDTNGKNDAKKNKDTNEKKDADKEKDTNGKIDTKKDATLACSGSIKATDKASKTTKENIETLDEQNTESDATFDEHIRKALAAKDYIIWKDDGSLLCILCDWELIPIDEETHLISEHHQTILKMHKKRGKELNTAKSEVANDTNSDNSDILDSIEKLQKNNININFETHTAVCKTCSKNLKFDLQVIENHVEEHNKPVQKKVDTTPIVSVKEESNRTIASGTLFTSPVFRSSVKNDKEVSELKPTEQKDENYEDIQKLAEKNELTYNPNTKKVHCPKCNKDIQCSLKDIHEHVFAVSHISNDQSSSSSKKKTKGNEIVKKDCAKKCDLKKVPLNMFMESLTVAINAGFQDIILNDVYCLSFLGFMFLTNVYLDKLRCLVCEETLYRGNVDKHCNEDKHSKALEESLVIIHPDAEFIREISTGLFHCGYCCIIEPSWDKMEDHLKLTSHKEAKIFSKWRLVQHAPNLERERINRVVQNDFLKCLHNFQMSQYDP